MSWEVASDVSSQIYTTDLPTDEAIPTSIKRAAIDAYSLMERCKEEKHIVEEEMANCIDDFYRRCLAIENSLKDIKKNESFSSSDLLNGMYSLQSKLLNEERYNLFVAYKLYQNEITICEEVRQYVEENETESLQYDCSEDDTDEGDDDNDEQEDDD